MSKFTNLVSDSVTMLRRDMKHAVRFPAMTIGSVVVPVMMMLLFRYVFGGAMGTALGGAGGGQYVNYLVPGVLVMAVGSAGAGTAIKVNGDMNVGIIARFRTMAVSRAAVLTGQVLGSFLRNMVALVAVLGVALLIGFRPAATPLQWLGVVGVLAVLVLAVTWLGMAFGLATKTEGGANSLAQTVAFLPFISSAFAPPSSMASGAAWFARNQPFTPIIDTLRDLFAGNPVGSSGILAIVWSVVLVAGGYLWSMSSFSRTPNR